MEKNIIAKKLLLNEIEARQRVVRVVERTVNKIKRNNQKQM